ncbi:MAG: hypothetical protein ACP5U1_13450 [Desulfomonilaceae bacterium]
MINIQQQRGKTSLTGRRRLVEYLGIALLTIFFGLCIVVMFVPFAEAEDHCLEIIKNLEQNSLRLKEYSTALQNAHKERDFQLITVLNGQIDETLKEIRVGEAELLNCPKSFENQGTGISSVKTQDTKFADLSCEDLKKRYIQLSRKFNSLARRQQSLLSELSPAQKAEYKEAEDSIKAVESELRKRCSPPPPPKPFQRRPVGPHRTFR